MFSTDCAPGEYVMSGQRGLKDYKVNSNCDSDSIGGLPYQWRTDKENL